MSWDYLVPLAYLREGTGGGEGAYLVAGLVLIGGFLALLRTIQINRKYRRKYGKTQSTYHRKRFSDRNSRED